MIDTRTDRENVERLAEICKTLGDIAHKQIGGSQYMRALWKAETTLLALLAECDALETKLEKAYQYALHFADAFTKKHFPENTGWEPFDDLLGLLTQIDNMTTVLQAKLDEAQAELREARMQAISDGCALQEAMEAQIGRVKVRDLEWEDFPSCNDPVLSKSVTPLGTYFICDDTDDFSGLYLQLIAHDNAKWWQHVRSTCDTIAEHIHGDIEPIKATAQADYERRILAALEPSLITPAEAAVIMRCLDPFEHLLSCLHATGAEVASGQLDDALKAFIRAIAAQGREDGE